MNSIPDFSSSEIGIIQSTVDERYRKAVSLELADAEVQLSPSGGPLAECPTVFWSENGTSFFIFKTGESRYRSQFLDRGGDLYRTERGEYGDLADCAVALLQVQSDLERQQNQASGAA